MNVQLLTNTSQIMRKNTKLTRMLLATALMSVATAFSAMAADFEVDGISYNVIGENEVEVTYNDSVKYTGEVFIPSTVVNGSITYQVTRIGTRAFYGCKNLSLVDIPEGVTSIGRASFNSCVNLENVDLPNSLVSIEESAFSYCHAITSFHVPRNLASLGEQVFMGSSQIQFFSCSSLNQHFKAVNGVLYSKDMTELYCYPVKATAATYEVPSPVARIHEYCFANNQSLTHVTFPETLRWIDMNIFRDCKGIETCYIPDSVYHMGVTVFGGCSNLTSVHLPANLDSLQNSMFMMCDKLTEVFIPRNVKYIGSYAFYRSGVKTVTIEEGSQLETIFDHAFSESYYLESLDMPNTVKTLGSSAFYRCDQLKSVHMSEALTSIGISTFCYCPLLTEGYIPGGVTNVKNAYARCENIKRMRIGSKDSAPGVTTIENCGIVYCEQIEYLELGANVDSLDSHGLVDLDNLKVLISWAAVPPRCDGYWHSFDPYSVYTDVNLYVPRASLEAYRNAADWKNFRNITAIEDVGDVDGNGIIDIVDITELIDKMLNGGEMNAARCDVDLNGTVGIGDITALIDKILNGN